MTSFSQELVEISEQGSAAVLATVVEAAGPSAVQPGAKCLIRDGRVRAETIGDAAVLRAIVEQGAALLSADALNTMTMLVHTRASAPQNSTLSDFSVRAIGRSPERV